MKICTQCKVPKEESDFPWRDESKGLKATQCKICHKERSSLWYQNNKQRQIANVRVNNSKYRKSMTQQLWNYLLGHPCVDCGEPDPVVLEFDHRDRSTKIGNVSTLVDKFSSFKSLLKEIEKCDVRCANCHRRKTAIQFGWYDFK